MCHHAYSNKSSWYDIDYTTPSQSDVNDIIILFQNATARGRRAVQVVYLTNKYIDETTLL